MQHLGASIDRHKILSDPFLILLLLWLRSWQEKGERERYVGSSSCISVMLRNWTVVAPCLKGKLIGNSIRWPQRRKNAPVFFYCRIIIINNNSSCHKCHFLQKPLPIICTQQSSKYPPKLCFDYLKGYKKFKGIIRNIFFPLSTSEGASKILK